MAGKRSKMSNAEFEKFKANLKKPPVKTGWDPEGKKPSLRRSIRERKYTDYESNTNDFWSEFSAPELRHLLIRGDELYDGQDSSKKAKAGQDSSKKAKDGDEEDDKSAHESEDAGEDASSEGNGRGGVGGTPVGSGGVRASSSASTGGPRMPGGLGGARTAGDFPAGASGPPSGGSLRYRGDLKLQQARLARYWASIARSHRYSQPSNFEKLRDFRDKLVENVSKE